MAVIRRQMALKLGIILPTIRVRDNAREVSPNVEVTSEEMIAEMEP